MPGRHRADGAASVTPSPDGDSVYVVSAGSDAVAIFDRDPVTGALAQKRGTQRCVSQDGSGGTCQDGTALDGVTDVTASLDGRSVYVASTPQTRWRPSIATPRPGR